MVPSVSCDASANDISEWWSSRSRTRCPRNQITVSLFCNGPFSSSTEVWGCLFISNFHSSWGWNWVSTFEPGQAVLNCDSGRASIGDGIVSSECKLGSIHPLYDCQFTKFSSSSCNLFGASAENIRESWLIALRWDRFIFVWRSRFCMMRKQELANVSLCSYFSRYDSKLTARALSCEEKYASPSAR